MLALKQLGDTSVSRAGAVLAGRAVQGRRLALLAILASARSRSVTRDKIIALLWPESPADRARHQLSDTLYILRSALGDDVIRATGDELGLNGELITSDAAEFERLLDAGQQEQAVALYRGPLLDGFHLRGAAAFEHWLDGERARVNQRYTAALEDLARRAEDAGETAAAVQWWRSLAAQDPYSSRVALGLMRSLDAAGDRAGALRHARIHAELLRQEFDAEPDGDVVALAAGLRLSAGRRTEQSADRPAAQPHEAGHDPARGRGAVQLIGGGGRGVSSRRPRVSALAAAAVLSLLALGAVYGVSALRTHTDSTEHALAVLPFVNMSAENDDYFADGLSEQIISVISRIPGLRVAARTSSFALRHSGLDIRAIGDTLAVNYVLEGSVRRDGNRLRVTAQLIDAATGYHTWSGDYDREMRLILEVQDEIAADIAQALELRIPVRAAQQRSRRSPDLQAYDLYLRALYLRDTFTPEALSQARQYLDRALELDPDFARAHALRATVLGPAIYWRYVPLEPGVAEARAAITRALALDPQLAEAHGALGMVKLFFDRDLPGAERALRRAVELNPNDHHAWHQLGNYYRATGRPLDAVRARERAIALDPLNVRMGLALAYDQVNALLIDEALAQFSRSMRVDPAHPLVLGLGPEAPVGPWIVAWKQGRHASAVAEYLRIASMRGASAAEIDTLRTAHQRDGMPAFWRSWLEFDLRHSAGDPDPVRVATFHALAGDRTAALDWLERAHSERNPAMVFVAADPMFAALREDPRFRRVSEGDAYSLRY